MIRRHLIVHGLVQGVGFRYHVAQWASLNRICGWVRNNYDGTVEIDAQGEEADMARFIELVRQGPRFARVSRLDIREMDQLELYGSFQVEEDF